MKNRLLCLFLSILMLLSATPTVQASEFSDTRDHWAQDYIDRAVEMELFNGLSESRFDPNGTMTRGMFVTVLGRLEGVDVSLWSADKLELLFDDVSEDAYYAPYINWASYCGIVNGMDENSFAPDVPVTREQMAKLVAYYVECMGHGLVVKDLSQQEPFADGDDISQWAADPIALLRATGILNGVANGDGTSSFLPQKTSTRAECAAVFCRLKDALVKDDSPQPESISLSDSERAMELGEEYSLTVSFEPADAMEVSLFWSSSNEDAFTVSDTGTVRCVGVGKATVSVYTANGLSASCVFTCNTDLASADESYEEKCLRVFGEVVDDPRLYYAQKDENGNYIYGSNGIPLMDYGAAAVDMVSITVNVWDFDKNGDKVTKTKTIQVHKNLAATFQQIFKEIYEGEELFPIHYLGGFSKGGKSEHTIGTAVDINPNENYYCDPNGNAIVGDYWKPGEDPYSIPLDGEVVAIFKKYGFTQGIYWRSGYKDYMHFSFFAT